jgi:hypothetical protein
MAKVAKVAKVAKAGPRMHDETYSSGWGVEYVEFLPYWDFGSHV